MKPPRWIWAFPFLLIFVPPLDVDGNAHRHRGWRGAHRPPNILIVVGDDHSGDSLGVAGDHHGATPRLDALARQGVWFNRAYCNAPLCTPSRQSFLTGRMPHAVGVTRLKTPLPDDAVTLGDWLGGLGYETAAFGKMHFNDGKPHGFDRRLDTADWVHFLREHPPHGGDRRHDWHPLVDPARVWLNADHRPAGLPESAMESTFVADQAAAFFRGRKGHDEPFLLVVGFYDPHAPFRFPDDWTHLYRPEEFPVPPVGEADRRERPTLFAGLSDEEVRGIQAAHYTAISFVDHTVGRIVDALDASGLSDETIVVYLGDNGYLRGQHGRFEKHCFYEPAVRVPLILRWPGHLPEGRRIGSLVELVDLFPTLTDLAGLPAPNNLHGRSLVPAVRDPARSPRRRVIVSEYTENEEAMARSDRFKLVVGSGRRARKDGYVVPSPPTGPYEHLFDLVADPDESRDLAGLGEFDPIRADLRHLLYSRLATTRDGVEPVPPGLDEAEAIRWCLVPRDRGPD